MEEEEDWDAPENSTAAKTTVPQPTSNSNSTENAQQTLKITDGYKYSYEALTSPANVEDWIDPPSYGTSKRIPNGFSQNSFRDNNKPFRNDRNERSDGYKRFDKRNNSYSNPSANFAAPKPSRFSRPLPNVNPTDWDAPVNSTPTPTNGLWNDNVNVPMANPIEDWDAPGVATPQSITNHKSTPMPVFGTPSSAKPMVDEEEDWDAPAGSTSKSDMLPPVELPTFRPSSAASVSMHSLHNESLNVTPSQPPMPEDEENWDEPGTPRSNTQVILPTFRPSNPSVPFPQTNEEDWDAEPSAASTDNGFAKNIPTYPVSGADDPFSSNQRYDGSWQANKYPRSRNFDSSNDHFSRDPYSRHSRGNFRNNQFDRGSRGTRGNRGNRGNRGGRDFNSPFNSRDNSRSRGDRSDRPYQPPVSFNNSAVEHEEDWDSPTGFSQKPPEKEKSAPLAPPLPPAAPPVEHEEESWD